MCSSSKHSERPWLYWKPSALGKLKALPSVVALEAPSPWQTWFLKVFLCILEDKLISLTFGMPYLVLQRSLSNSPQDTDWRGETKKALCKGMAVKTFLSSFFGSSSSLWVKMKPATSLTVFPQTAMFGNFWQWERWYFEGVVEFSQWQNYNNISCFYHTVITGNVSYSAFFKNSLNLEIYFALILKIKCIW